MNTSYPALLITLLLCAGIASATAAQTLEFEPYAFQTSRHGTIDAEVAFFDVPRRHDEPGGPSMRLRVVRLPAHDRTSTRSPIVYLAGGPGGSGVGTARGPRWPVFDRVRQHADVLLLDQRGTGLSERVEECPERHAFLPGQWAEPEGYQSELAAVALRCVELWRAQGVDLDAFNTRDSAHDIDALRRALGVERLNLWGMSYGTHLAMAVLRDHGAHIERVVLMGVEGPDDTLKRPLDADRLLERLDGMLREDPAATELGIELIPSIERLLARLEQSPAEGRVRRLGRSERVTIGRFDAQLAIAASLGRSTTIRLLPLAIAEAERGNHDVLAELVYRVRQWLGTFNAMSLAMDIASGASGERLDLVADGERRSLLGAALNFPFPGISADLGIGVLGDNFRAPIESDVPALLISGDLDGRTPPSNADAVAAGFVDVRHLLIGNASHDDDLWLAHGDIADRIAGFFAGDSMPDARLSAPPIDFAVSKYGELWRLVVRNGDGSVRGWVLSVALLVVLLPMVVVYRWRQRRALAAQ